MELVGQLTPFTCVLACLESFFKDIGLDHDQCTMLRDYPSILYVPEKRDAYGAVDDNQLRRLADKLGFDCDSRQYGNKVDLDDYLSSLEPDQAVLFIMTRWRNETNHCVRFSEISEQGEYQVMNPQFLDPRKEAIIFQELLDWNYRVFVITRR